jgi:hypothetical protein
MSPAYENLSSIGTPLSIFSLSNDYLMSGHPEASLMNRERDKHDLRDRVNAKAMKDPRIQSMGDPKDMPFDCKRMVYGGFKVLVDI